MNISSRAIIKTRFLGPTNNRGARIKATCQAGSITIPYAYELASGGSHWLAAQKLIKKCGLQWGEKFTVGSDNNGYYFIPCDGFNTVNLEG
jgi:hypothetical protein